MGSGGTIPVMFKSRSIFDRRQVLLGAGAAAVAMVLPKYAFAIGERADLGTMVRREYHRNLQIVEAGRELLGNADGTTDQERAMAVAAVSELSGRVERGWYYHCRQTDQAALSEVDANLHIGLTYAAMRKINSDRPAPMTLEKVTKLLDILAKCGRDYFGDLA